MANLNGLGLLAMEIVALMSDGKSATIEEVEKHIDDADVVEFIIKSFNKSLSIDFTNPIYDIAALNKYFNNYSGYINGNESRKYGIVNDDDGLLLLVSLILDEVTKRCSEWEI